METSFKEVIWKQFGATIEMLENAIQLCPDRLWDTATQFWYNAYHTLFYLDYYLTLDPDHFAPPAPFTLSEMDPSGVLPDKTYSRDELLTYLAYCKNKCHDLIAGLTEDEMILKTWSNPYRTYSIFEILLYNMRHVQHHTAQLNLHLRQGIDEAPKWVSQTKTPL